MAADHFFARWAKPQPATASVAPAAESIDAIEPSGPPVAPPAPTMDDVAHLTMDSDYAPFMARGVDQLVQRGAMKKLFADPHFNVMDGLDIYIGDYNTADPIPAAMLALLEHAKGVLDPLSMFEKPVMQLVSASIPESKPDPTLESELEPNSLPEIEAPAARSLEQPLPGFEPPVEPPEPVVPLEPTVPAVPATAPHSARDPGRESRIDSQSGPQTTLPDTDEHTIQGL